MQLRGSLLILAVAVAALGLTACGSETPASPSGAGGGVTLEGVLLGPSATFTASDDDGSAGSGDGPITVEVVGTDISVTISANGTFKIEDIPEGGITLRFLQGDVLLARIDIPYAAEGTTVKIVVKKEGKVIVLVDLDMDDHDDGDGPDDTTSTTCMVSGGREGDGIELEGTVDRRDGQGGSFFLDTNRSPEAVHVLADKNDYRCNGKTAGDGECWEAAGPGARVHVRGTLTTCTTGEATVTATEVKVQKAAS